MKTIYIAILAFIMCVSCACSTGSESSNQDDSVTAIDKECSDTMNIKVLLSYYVYKKYSTYDDSGQLSDIDVKIDIKDRKMYLDDRMDSLNYAIDLSDDEWNKIASLAKVCNDKYEYPYTYICGGCGLWTCQLFVNGHMIFFIEDLVKVNLPDKPKELYMLIIDKFPALKAEFETCIGSDYHYM
jgi:hypothetical protein